ncbi:MAG: hypothetical protein ACPG32_08115 [Akkermansiaceae bacterium]
MKYLLLFSAYLCASCAPNTKGVRLPDPADGFTEVRELSDPHNYSSSAVSSRGSSGKDYNEPANALLLIPKKKQKNWRFTGEFSARVGSSF